MRILFCGINYAPDLIGVAKYNTELCEGLKDRGHEVRVVTGPPYYPRWEIPAEYRSLVYRAEIIEEIPLRRAPIYVPKNPSGPRRLIHHASFALTSAVPVVAEALRWRPHVVFSVAPSLMSAAAAARAARLVGASSWLHLQDFEIDAAFDLGLLRNRGLRNVMVAVERNILRSFDRVSTIAAPMLQRLQYKGVDPHRLREIRNWVDTSEVAPGERMTGFRSELKLGASDFIALYSGTMSNKQGLDLIIEAAREIEHGQPHVKFVLCGDGPHRPRLEALAAGLGNVHFIELQADDRFAQLLNSADVHLIPQKAAAADLVLPSKLGGILASGRPVITMARPGSGLAEEVAGAGLIVAPGDVHELAAAIRTIADDAELRHSLGVNARRRAEERWDKRAILRMLESEIQAVCDPHYGLACSPAL